MMKKELIQAIEKSTFAAKDMQTAMTARGIYNFSSLYFALYVPSRANLFNKLEVKPMGVFNLAFSTYEPEEVISLANKQFRLADQYFTYNHEKHLLRSYSQATFEKEISNNIEKVLAEFAKEENIEQKA